MLYTINNPLKIEAVNQGYYSDTQLSSEVEKDDEFVSKEIAIALLKALKESNKQLRYLRETFGDTEDVGIITRNNLTITNAEK